MNSPNHKTIKVLSLWRLIRPNNVLIAMLSVLLIAFLGKDFSNIQDIIMAILTAALIMAGANIINDIFDIKIDRINKPDRPLPSGAVTVREALVLFFLTYLLAWICAATISLMMFLIALFVGLLLIAYSYKFKRTILAGNLTVSASTAAAFLYGGLAIGDIHIAVFPAIFAFLFHFGREIIKDMQDVKGDLSAGANTLAIAKGPQFALQTVLLTFLVLIVVTIIPYILGIYGIIYLSILILGVYPVLGYVLFQCWKNPEPRILGRMSDLLKADMLVGLMAIYFG